MTPDLPPLPSPAYYVPAGTNANGNPIWNSFFTERQIREYALSVVAQRDERIKELEGLIKELTCVNFSFCDECGGEEKACPRTCIYRRAKRVMGEVE